MTDPRPTTNNKSTTNQPKSNSTASTTTTTTNSSINSAPRRSQDTDAATIANAASLFPVGSQARKKVKAALTTSANPANTIATFQQENSLQALMTRALTDDSNRSSFWLETDSVMTFLSHLEPNPNGAAGASAASGSFTRFSIHQNIATKIRLELQNCIQKLNPSQEVEHEALLVDLLTSVWLVYGRTHAQSSSDANIRGVLIVVLKKLGGEKIPKALLQRLAHRVNNVTCDMSKPQELSAWLKHGELLTLLGMSLQRAVFAADFESRAASIMRDPIDRLKPAQLQPQPIFRDWVQPYILEYCSDEVLVRSSNKAFVGSARERRISTQQLRRTNPALGKIKEIVGKDIALLSALFGLLICDHGRLCNKSGINSVLGGSRYLRCCLVSDVLISFTGQLPKTFRELSALAKVFDQCVKEGEINDSALIQIQACLRNIFQVKKNLAQKQQIQSKPLQSNDVDDGKLKGAKAKISITKVSKEDREFSLNLIKTVLIAAIDAMQEADPQQLFLNPVTDAIAPGYSRVISKPMCILNIQKKIDSLQYVRLEDFNDDVQLMFNNCITYNIGKDNSWFRTEARRQNKIFKGVILPQARSIYKTKTTERLKSLGKSVSDDNEEGVETDSLKKVKKRKRGEGALSFIDQAKAGTSKLDEAETTCKSEIDALPELKCTHESHDLSLPSMAALASMIMTDPFVVRLLLDKSFRLMRKTVPEKEIPVQNKSLPSFLQLLHIVQFSTNTCASKGRELFIPGSGLVKTKIDTSSSPISDSDKASATLRYFVPRITQLILDLAIDKRMSAGGNLNEVSTHFVKDRPITDPSLWRNASSMNVVVSSVEGLLAQLLRPGQCTESSLKFQLPRLLVPFKTFVSEGQVINDRPFWYSIANSLLGHRTKLTHIMRDLIITFLLDIIRTSEEFITSVAHETFVWLLNEWTHLGNVIMPVNLRLSTLSRIIKDTIEKEKFSSAWKESSENKNNSFCLIQTEYERLLNGVPKDKGEEWKVQVGILVK